MKPNNLTVAQVAARTGLTERAIYDRLRDGSLVAHGGRNGITEDAVTRFIVSRQLAAVARIGDLTRFAEDVRKRARQPGGPKGTFTTLDQDARDVFGPHVVRAASMRENRGCRWCWARMTASVHGGLEPQLTPAHRLLLGEPCQQDLKAMRDALFARRRKPDQTPDTTPPAAARRASAARTDAAAPRGRKRCGTPVGTPCSCHSSDRPGGPHRQDNGTDLTAARRTALTASLQAARDRGDRKHAQQIQRLLTALKPQAVRGSKSATSTPRSRPHGCGCQCEQHRGQS